VLGGPGSGKTALLEAAMHRLLARPGGTARLLTSSRQAALASTERLLAYVWLADGTFWNALLVAEGYAQQLTVPPNVTYAGLFRRLAAEARRQDRGLWATSVTQGDTR
jgi:endonuclease YncB( thermonuclease family)